MKAKQIWKQLRLTVMFGVLVFCIVIASTLLTSFVAWTILTTGFLKDAASQYPLIFYLGICLLIGLPMSLLFSYVTLRPMRQTIEAVDQLASGNFNVRVHLHGGSDVKRLSESINHMAEELGSIEMLRSDFVNNFSHEFKTPIVSIRGFARLLKRSDLTETEREEYLDTIIVESERLSDLSNNVLQLSKLEQQSILTGQTTYDLTEQLRQVVAMLYSKWSAKEFDVKFEVPELTVCANKAMLEQVWLNLVDNAIKFSLVGSAIRISGAERQGTLCIQIENRGSPISEKEAAHIFDRFYQADTSHTQKGNGLGLTITAKIVQLHHGSVQLLRSDADSTIFEVKLPV